MCGIAGIITSKIIKKEKINELLFLMKNRGPDGQKFFHIRNNQFNYYLFFSRLSILDLNNRSMQPFRFKNLILVFNGEIYNYLEVKKTLQNHGYNFETNSDTEVLIKAWDKWGEECLKKFDGMWAFAILNIKTFNLYISRDIFGEKPLYYSLSGDNLIFGSQVNYISCLKDNHIKINYSKVKTFLFNGYKSLNYDDGSFFHGIKKVNSSTVLKFNSGLSLTSKKYYEIKISKTKQTEKELLNELSHEFKNSLKIRLRSDVKKSFMISGGVDSNSIIASSKVYFKERIHSYSILSSSKFHNENKYIKLASKISDKVKFLDLNRSQSILSKNFDKMNEFHFAPIPSLSSVLTFSLANIIKKDKNKIVFSGIGGDELFLGYYKHFIYFLNKNKKVKNNLHLNIWKKNILPIVKNPNLRSYENINEKSINKYKFNYDFSKSFFKNHKMINIKKYSKEFTTNDLIKNDQYQDIFREVIPVMLDQDDLNFMYHSIENRSPLLSKKILEIAFKTPTNLNFKDGYPKYPLRKIMKNIVNEKILNNKSKVGFSTTLNQITKINSGLFEKTILKSDFMKDTLNIKSLKKNIKNPQSIVNSQQMFNIYSTAKFLNKFE